MNLLPITLQSLSTPTEPTDERRILEMLNEVNSELDNLLSHLDSILTTDTSK
jgi:hypothetical protein